MKVAIVNYGLGNINSIKNAVYFGQKNIALNLVDDPDQLIHYDKVILPGVGAFEDAMRLISDKNFDDASMEIPHGRMTREVGINMVKLYDANTLSSLNTYLEFLEISVEEFYNMVEPMCDLEI